MKIEDIILVGAMGPPGGGRNAVTQRLQRHFNIMTYTDLQYSSIKNIFQSITSAYLTNFSDEVKQAIEGLVDISINVYDRVLFGELKPIPTKSFYTFNLRDISRIFQGIALANKTNCTNEVQLIRMWYHENLRVFGDRLINNTDRKWLDDLLCKEAKGKFNLEKKEIFNSERLIYGDYLDGIDVENRVYKQIVDLKGFVHKIEEYLEDYNSMYKIQMKLVMFLDACDHVSRISRVIRQPLGNALLLGVGGSGRQSLSRLATHLANFKLFNIEVIKGYAMMNWRDDCKKALMQAGVENKPTSFLFVDT